MSDLNAAKDEAFTKVGRNVLMFQQMELLLKHLVINGEVSGHPSELAAKRDRYAESVMKQTLGMVTGKHLNPGEPMPVSDDHKEAHLSFSFRMNYRDEKREQFEALVKERNHLVNKFLLDVNMDSVEDWLAASERLDSQCERIEIAIEDLQHVSKAVREGQRRALDYLVSDEFKAQLKI